MDLVKKLQQVQKKNRLRTEINLNDRFSLQNITITETKEF